VVGLSNGGVTSGLSRPLGAEIDSTNIDDWKKNADNFSIVFNRLKTCVEHSLETMVNKFIDDVDSGLFRHHIAARESNAILYWRHKLLIGMANFQRSAD
jgi:hypothetical protein